MFFHKKEKNRHANVHLPHTHTYTQKMVNTYLVAGSLAREIAAFHPLATSCKSTGEPPEEGIATPPLFVGDDDGNTISCPFLDIFFQLYTVFGSSNQQKKPKTTGTKTPL